MTYSQRINGHEMDAWAQAAATLRWLENSGPRYRDVVVTLVLCKNEVAEMRVDGQTFVIKKTHMSHASWCLCRSAESGDILELRLRDDPIYRAAVFP